MSLRIVSVSGPALLRMQDTQLWIEKDGELRGRVPLEDMAVLVLDGPDLTLSHQLLASCASRGIAVLTSDEKHLPNGLLLPLSGHTLHTATLRQQIDAGAPATKRVWQTIVKAKIVAQANLVSSIGGDAKVLRKLLPLVRSGDPDNIEARAAARYWELSFGEAFVRNRDEPGLNACLNYGYAIIRSAVARAVVGAGLHPALGVFHRNQYNPLCLADDAMEPLRTMVDREVLAMRSEDVIQDELTPAMKRRLVGVLGGFVRLADVRYPLMVGLERYAASLRRAICESDFLEPIYPDFALLE